MKKFFAVLLMICFTFLTGCFKENDISSIEIDKTTVHRKYALESFDLSTIDLIINYEDGKKETIRLDSTMISDNDYEKLSQLGEHEIKIVYKHKSTVLKIKLVSDLNTLVVGTTNIIGDFLDKYASSYSDENVQNLIYGYSLFIQDESGKIKMDTNTVLANDPYLDAVQNDDGTKTYKFVLKQDLKWNNGEKITAKDYVAYVLLLSSKDWSLIASSQRVGVDLLGYERFRYGEPISQMGDYDPNYTVLNQKFTGVRLLSEYEFSLTIAADKHPNFYEALSVTASPLHLQTYLPGFEIKDDGDGAYITHVNGNKSILETLKSTVIGENGQQTKPTITAGPYQFVSYEDKKVLLKSNPYYKGNYEGKRPWFQNIEIKYLYEFDLEEVINEDMDLLVDVTATNIIDQAMNSDILKYTSYPKNHLGAMTFSQYFGPTKYAEVRRALGYLIDRNVIVDQFLGGYGSIVNGPFLGSEWFYQSNKDELDSKIINYTISINKANEELDKSPYKFEADGKTPFDPQKATRNNEYYRYDSNGNILEINHLSASMVVSDLIDDEMSENAWRAGVKFNLTSTLDFSLILNHYYYGANLLESERKYHSFFLVQNISSEFKPYNEWHSDKAGTQFNPGGTMDPEIDRITEAISQLSPSQVQEFNELFLEFAERWNEILPYLPLYCSENFIIHHDNIGGLNITSTWSWSKDICDIEFLNK